MKRTIYVLAFTLAAFSIMSAQTTTTVRPDQQPNYFPQPDPLQSISQETAKISKSVQALNTTIKELLEKFAVGKGMQLNDRQQKLLLGFEVLNRAEQRLEILQKFQIELTQKDGEVRKSMAQVEENLLPGSIERDTAVIGTTQGNELRENRRQKMETERRSLQILSAQIQRNLQQTSSEMREAENLVQMLRRKVLPQIEAEISDL